MSAHCLAEATGLPEPTVSKVLKLLAKSCVVNSVRGVNGGYSLARGTADINVAQIVRAIEGPVTLATCVENSPESCGYAACCPVKGRWDAVNSVVKAALESVSLADMIRDDYKLPNSKTTETPETQGAVQ